VDREQPPPRGRVGQRDVDARLEAPAEGWVEGPGEVGGCEDDDAGVGVGGVVVVVVAFGVVG
jgi:hypothetical protein